MSSFVALRDLDGLPGASNLPYFFLDVLKVSVPFVEMCEDVMELVFLLTVYKIDKIWLINLINKQKCFEL